MDLPRNPTRGVKIGSVTLGAGHKIAVQSMTATHTRNVAATVGQVNDLEAAGADIVRIAVDNSTDAEALIEIRAQTGANLSVDLQENYRLAEAVAPHVDKIRYNPGHLYHHERQKPWQDKVKFLVDVAATNDCAMRVGVNCGSVDPAKLEKYSEDDSITPMLESAWEHCELLDSLGFTRYCVSLKDSDPAKVIEVNRRFSERRPDVPLHLGVTEAGMPPDGIIKTRIALEQLISRGIGDTIRVSLTPAPGGDRTEEVQVAQQILQSLGLRSFTPQVSACPGCGRTTSTFFQEMAERIQAYLRAKMPVWSATYPGVEEMRVAVMG
ncbi:MAG: (E)-4-hydroxy-3-methylbut-2-enyl-diphosphate synthase, partial [Pirellulales bacterium]